MTTHPDLTTEARQLADALGTLRLTHASAVVRVLLAETADTQRMRRALTEVQEIINRPAFVGWVAQVNRIVTAALDGAPPAEPTDADRSVERCPDCQGPRETVGVVGWDNRYGKHLCENPFHAAATDTGGAIEFNDTADYRDIGNGERVLTGIRRLTLVTSNRELANGVAGLVRKALADAARRRVIEETAAAERLDLTAFKGPDGEPTTMGRGDIEAVARKVADEHTADQDDDPDFGWVQPEPEDRRQPFNHRMCGTRHTVEQGCPIPDAEPVDQPAVKIGDRVVILECPEPRHEAEHVDMSGLVTATPALTGRPTVRIENAGQCTPVRWRHDRAGRPTP